MIHIKGLRKEFDQGTVAIENLELTFDSNTFVALLGPSGCGKTTTLNCIAGLLEPTAGAIWFDDEDVTGLAPKDRNIGMVFQSYALYPHMKVIDNIAFPLKQKGMPKQERHAKAKEMAVRLRIEHLLERKPTQLSGGQQQRVAMARALVKQPRILLLDEPMSNLDARLRIEIRDEIRRLQQDLQLTAVIVTHDQEEAMAIADKIAILDNGRIQQFDTPEALYHYPANLFVAHFMGNPPMNFIDTKLSGKPDAITLDGKGFCMPVPAALHGCLSAYIGKQVKIGVRSHQINVLADDQEGGIPMHLQIVENLGKELMLSGYVDESYVRITLADPTSEMVDRYQNIRKGDNPFIWLRLQHFNVFDDESGTNLTVDAIR